MARYSPFPFLPSSQAHQTNQACTLSTSPVIAQAIVMMPVWNGFTNNYSFLHFTPRVGYWCWCVLEEWIKRVGALSESALAEFKSAGVHSPVCRLDDDIQTKEPGNYSRCHYGANTMEVRW